MRFIEGTVTSLHGAGRALESLSLRIGAGKCCSKTILPVSLLNDRS